MIILFVIAFVVSNILMWRVAFFMKELAEGSVSLYNAEKQCLKDELFLINLEDSNDKN